MSEPAAKPPLSRQSIIDAAIALADAEGLDAVSIRRLAARLRARPMSLYRFVESKDHLIGEMVDGVIAEMLLDRMPTDWRAALRSIARRTLEVGYRHPWLIAATTRSTDTGPNRSRHSAQSFQAVAPLGLGDDVVRPLLAAVDVYTMGSAVSLRPDRTHAERREDQRALDQGLDWLLDGFERSHPPRS